MIAYLDCSTGVSGDKFLGALTDAGFDLDLLRGALADLGLTQIVIDARACRSNGVTGIGLSVTEPGAPRRHWAELRDLLQGSNLPDQVREGTLRALEAIAAAEAQMHGVAIEKVHFHEIGAADTIVDTLGVALGIHTLGITRIVASPVAVGSGTVECAHGTLPVPAPATALLLTGVPIVAGVAGELTTPTGAALLAAHVAAFGPPPEMTVRRVGTGCGTRDLGFPNVCRMLVGQPPAASAGTEDVVVLESNIDHLTAEELAYAAQRLLAAGALDVWMAPIVMKKGRPATLLSALSAAAAAPALAEAMIAETGTLGVRLMPATRLLVERDVTEVTTSLGTAHFKIAHLPQGRVLRVEADDAARIARDNDLDVAQAAARLEADAARITGVQPMRQSLPSATTNPSD